MDSRPPIKRESDSLLGAGLPEAEQFQIKIVKQESDPGDYQRGTGSSSVPQIPGFPQTNPGEPQVKIKEEVLDPSYHVDPMDGTVLSFTVGETDPETLQMKEEGEGAASGSYVEGTSVPFADGGFPSAGQEIYQTKIKEEPDPEFYPNPVKSSVASLPDGGLFTEVKIENEQMDTEDPLPTIRSEIVSFPVPERRPAVHQDIMCKQRRLSYNISFKLEVVSYAKEHGNRAAARHFGPPPTEKMIREWRKQEEQLQKTEKNKCTLRGHVAKWPQLDEEMKNWIMQHRNSCSEHKTEREPNCASCCAKGS